MPKHEDPGTAGAEAPATGPAKTPRVLKPTLKEEVSPGTRADFETFLKQRKARTFLDDAALLDKMHPSVIHQSINLSAWVPNTPILYYSARTWIEWD